MGCRKEKEKKVDMSPCQPGEKIRGGGKEAKTSGKARARRKPVIVRTPSLNKIVSTHPCSSFVLINCGTKRCRFLEILHEIFHVVQISSQKRLFLLSRAYITVALSTVMSS